jgi:hypothetical protein
MDDIELSRKVDHLRWYIDIERGTCKSELVFYEIIRENGFIDLKSVWISPSVPAAVSTINKIQRSAVAALEKELQKKNDEM